MEIHLFCKSENSNQLEGWWKQSFKYFPDFAYPVSISVWRVFLFPLFSLSHPLITTYFAWYNNKRLAMFILNQLCKAPTQSHHSLQDTYTPPTPSLTEATLPLWRQWRGSAGPRWCCRSGTHDASIPGPLPPSYFSRDLHSCLWKQKRNEIGLLKYSV